MSESGEALPQIPPKEQKTPVKGLRSKILSVAVRLGLSGLPLLGTAHQAIETHAQVPPLNVPVIERQVNKTEISFDTPRTSDVHSSFDEFLQAPRIQGERKITSSSIEDQENITQLKNKIESMYGVKLLTEADLVRGGQRINRPGPTTRQGPAILTEDDAIGEFSVQWLQKVDSVLSTMPEWFYKNENGESYFIAEGGQNSCECYGLGVGKGIILENNSNQREFYKSSYHEFSHLVTIGMAINRPEDPNHSYPNHRLENIVPRLEQAWGETYTQMALAKKSIIHNDRVAFEASVKGRALTPEEVQKRQDLEDMEYAVNSSQNIWEKETVANLSMKVAEGHEEFIRWASLYFTPEQSEGMYNVINDAIYFGTSPSYSLVVE